MSVAVNVPDKPALEGLEAKWNARWDADGIYRFDRSADRSQVFSIDTPPPTVSGSLHVGHVFSFTHTDLVARFQRMRGRVVFYPMGWDDNGLPTERRVQNYYGVRCDPSLPYDAGLVERLVRSTAAGAPGASSKGAPPLSVSRPNFVELCAALTAEDEKAFESALAPPGPVGGLVADLRDDWQGCAVGVAAVVPESARRQSRLPGRSPDVVGRRFPYRRRAGRTRGSRASGRVPSPAIRPPRRRRSGRDRDDAAGADSRVRGAGRASGRCPVSSVDWPRSLDAAVQGSGADQGARARGSRKRHGRRDDLHLWRRDGRHLVA